MHGSGGAAGDRARGLSSAYSHNDLAAATALHHHLAHWGLSVFFDKTTLHAGDRWLDELQAAIDRCGAFVVLVGRDGLARWVGAETRAALERHIGAHKASDRLPIFPVLIDGIGADALPAFLRLHQATAWDSASQPDETLLAAIREGTPLKSEATIQGPPFVGLAAFRTDQAHMFFGRWQETLSALACFGHTTRPPRHPVGSRSNGTSGSGASAVLDAGGVVAADRLRQGLLWSRTRVAALAADPGRWRSGGATDPRRAGREPGPLVQGADGRFDPRVGARRRRACRYWLRERQQSGRHRLLACHRPAFEELFTFAEAGERWRFDQVLAAALADPDCPLFVLSTVRADFLDRFGECAPELIRVLNQVGKRWTLASIGEADLREVINGPARLAGLNVDEVRARQCWTRRAASRGRWPHWSRNALDWLWQRRDKDRLSGSLFTEQGGLAGLLSRSADDLLNALGPQQERALELLFRLVKVDLEGGRHARQRIRRQDAIEIAGGGEAGFAMVNRLSGQRQPGGGGQVGPLRLITVGDDGAVDLIHETLIRSKGVDAAGKPQPYWPTLWNYIEQQKERAAWHERLRLDMQMWLEHGKAPGFQWSHERVRELHRMLQKPGPKFEFDAGEGEFLGPIDADAMVAELDRPETEHKRRLLIGERLAVLGDPRPGVGVDERGTPWIDWRPVKGGEVTISILSDRNEPNSGVTKRIRQRVSCFQIARYPVTVSQYRAFLDAEDGWCWIRRGGDMIFIATQTERPTSSAVSATIRQSLLTGSIPVAFCRWISRRFSLDICLPDEWQRQLAATGGDDQNLFPWGADWDTRQEPWRANTFESRLGQATAVGMYPAGATVGQAAILDMSGTVYEWCLNKFDRPKKRRARADDLDFRVLRGGSCLTHQEHARSAHRDWGSPDIRYTHLGFRVVCRPSLSAGH